MISSLQNIENQSFFLPAIKPTPLDQLAGVYSSSALIYLAARILQIVSNQLFCFISRYATMLEATFFPKKRPYYTPINHKIYLGAMPLNNWNHLETIYKLGVKTILSLNENHEFKPSPFASPVQPHEWKKHKIKWIQLPQQDLKPLKPNLLSQSVNYVVDEVKKSDRSIYIHCLAGRGRSACVTICSLVKLYGLSLEQAIYHVKSVRSQVKLSREQIETMVSWYKENELKRQI